MPFGDACSIDVGTGTTVGTVASIGVESYANWQQFTGFPNWTATNIEDQTGSATTTDLVLATGFGNRDTRAVGSGDLFNMFTRAVGVSTSTTTLAYAQIPYTTYDIIVYVCEEASSPSGALLTVTDGTTSYYYESQAADNFNGGTFGQITSTDSGTPDTTGNYVRFSSITGASKTISLTNSVASMTVVGIQLIEVTAGGGGRIMSSLAGAGGLAYFGGIAGKGGGLAG